MLKYQKKGLCKALSMLLVVVMLLTAPIGITQTYALEDGQPSVTDVQGELPLGTSDGTPQPSEVPKSDMPPETLTSPSEALTSATDAKLDVNTTAVSKVLEVSTLAEFQNALWRALDGDIIQLNKDIIYNDNTTGAYAVITIKGKNITLDMNGHNLTIGNTGFGMGLKLEKAATNERNATQLHVIGNGKLKISSTGHALSVGASKFTSASTVKVELWSAYGAGIGGSLADVDIQNGSVTGNNGIYVAHNSNIIVKGPIKATVETGIKITPSKVNPEDIGCVVSVDSVEAGRMGISMDGGNVTIDGTVTAPAYIQFNEEDSTAIDGYLATTTKDGYRTYQHSTAGTVWVKGEALIDTVCEIDGTKYATLNEALAAIGAGATKTIKLRQSVTYTDPIVVDKKTINFDLGNYDLLLDTSAELSYTPALRVTDGGKVKLTGTGTGRFNVKASSTAIAINGMNSEATVHNVEVTGDNDGVYMVGTGDYLDSNSTVTVMGDIKAEKGNGVTVNAKNGKVIVNGNITAGKIGVEIASNPGTQVIVNGNITVTDDTPENIYNMIGIRAYGQTVVTVTGNVTVRGTNCVGVHASGSTIQVEGNVASSGKGAHSDARGRVEITGSLSAGSPFITVGTTEMTADQATETGPDFLVYTDGTSIVQIGSVDVPAHTYTITVQNDGNGTASANVNSAVQNAEVTLTAIPNDSFRFKEWQVVSGGVTVSGNKFNMPSGNVTVKAIFEKVSIPTYAVIVTNGSGDGEYAEGAEVSITADTAESGKEFKEWTGTDGIIFTEGSKNNSFAKFTMPDHAITVTATYMDKVVIPDTYTVTLSGAGTDATGAGSYIKDATVNIYAGSRIGYNFIGWTSTDVTITSANNKNASFTMLTKNVTVTANWTYSGGSSGGGNSSGGSSNSSSSTVITTTPEKNQNQPVMAVVFLTATAGTSGIASANVPDKAITDAIAKAQADARTQGGLVNDIYISLYLTMPQGATSLSITISENALQSLVNAGVFCLEINGAPVSLGFDLKALQEIQKQSSGNVTILITSTNTLSSGARALIGTRPVYNITISYVKGGKTVNITSLGNGSATLSIPYVLSTNEAAGYLFGVYVDGSGNATRIPSSAYDSGSRSVIFITNHFSLYGVGYTAPSAMFTDTSTHWAKETIDYVVGRGLLTGTSDTTFAPDTVMTRGILVTALGRLANVDTKAYTTCSFSDVKADSDFRPYIEWAYKKGVVQGIGNSQFAPDRAITREEIADIFTNYAEATGYKLPVARVSTTYADASSIESVYKTAVTAMQQAGIMMGGTDNKFNPKASATRAEVSSMLHRYVKLTIDPTTAQGWALNDAGQFLYYKDGKPLTGIQTIEGAKYFFNTDGTLKTSWVKDGDNWRRSYDRN